MLSNDIKKIIDEEIASSGVKLSKGRYSALDDIFKVITKDLLTSGIAFNIQSVIENEAYKNIQQFKSIANDERKRLEALRDNTINDVRGQNITKMFKQMLSDGAEIFGKDSDLLCQALITSAGYITYAYATGKSPSEFIDAYSLGDESNWAKPGRRK